MEITRVWPEHFGLRGLSDHGYYPMQFEIIEQSEGDWQTNDTSTMMIQINAIPINYDLVVKDNSNRFEYLNLTITDHLCIFDHHNGVSTIGDHPSGVDQRRLIGTNDQFSWDAHMDLSDQLEVRR